MLDHPGDGYHREHSPQTCDPRRVCPLTSVSLACGNNTVDTAMCSVLCWVRCCRLGLGGHADLLAEEDGAGGVVVEVMLTRLCSQHTHWTIPGPSSYHPTCKVEGRRRSTTQTEHTRIHARQAGTGISYVLPRTMQSAELAVCDGATSSGRQLDGLCVGWKTPGRSRCDQSSSRLGGEDQDGFDWLAGGGACIGLQHAVSGVGVAGIRRERLSRARRVTLLCIPPPIGERRSAARRASRGTTRWARWDG